MASASVVADETVRVFADALPDPLGPGDPEFVGPWKPVGRLGAGGMGTVYLGVRDGQRAAVKVIHPLLAADPEFVRRFRRETELAQQVSAVCTAAVLDVELDGPRPYLATEYVPGPTLRGYIQEHGPLTGDTLTAFAVGVTDALTAIHDAGIVHRDLTPQNVMLSADGPRIVDFGIARATDGTSMTSTGMAMGTPGWIAPEVLRGADSSPESDVFALGSLLAFAASGRRPFGEGPTDAVLYRVVHEEPDVPDELPHALATLVRRCLDKRPETRPRPKAILGALIGEDRGNPEPGTQSVTRLLDQSWNLPLLTKTLELNQQGRPRGRTYAAIAAVLLGIASVGLAVALAFSGLTSPEAIPSGPSVGAEDTTTEDGERAADETPGSEESSAVGEDSDGLTSEPSDAQAPPRPTAPDPAWAGSPHVASTHGELAVLDFWDDYSHYITECDPLYPVGIEDGLGVELLGSPGWGASHPALIISWGPNFENPDLTARMWMPEDSRNVQHYFNNAPEVTFSDESELYVHDSDPNQNLLAIAGQSCFWEIEASSRAALSWGQSLQTLRRG